MSRTENITTLQLAYDHFFPGCEPVEIRHYCAWLARLPVERLIALMEQIAAQDSLSPLRTPAAAIWTQIKRESPDYTRDAIRFDSSGTRV